MSLVQNFEDRVPTQVLDNGAIRYEEFNSSSVSQGYRWFKRADEPSKVGNKWNKVIYDGIKEVLEDTYHNIPRGFIGMWSGSANAIPDGWLLCNGQNGTPDLRNRFIVGAGDEYSVGATGGEKEHTLTTDEMPSHTHNNKLISSEYGNYGSTPYVKFEYTASNNGKYFNYESQQPKTEATGGGQAHENRPPYYALAFIMKA